MTRVTRRTALQAGLLGATAVAVGTTWRPKLASAASTSNAEPAPGLYDFNQDWLFGGPYVSGSEQPGYPETGFATVEVPHTVVPLSWGDWDNTTWEQVWIYRRHIPITAVDGARVFVDFDGVMTSATVYLGGAQIAQHQGGFLPFSVELTNNLVVGDNVLAVVVDGTWQDVPPQGDPRGAWTVDFLMPAGLYRDVELRVVPDPFISDVFALPKNVLTASPSVDVEVSIDVVTLPSAAAVIDVALMDGTTQIAGATATVTLGTAGVTVVPVTLAGFGHVALWSPDSPSLYQVAVTLTAGAVTDSSTVNIGFREATFQLDGFYLNGQRFEIFGLNRHQLFPYTGMAAPARLQRRDAELLKYELNCNMVRCSHYPQSPAFLDACDELGVMIWEEPPGWEYVGDAAFQQIVVQNVQDMVLRDRNRPSVIVWATRLNETSNYVTLYAQTRALANSLDGSRQTTGAMDTQSLSGWAEDVFAYDDYHSGGATLQPPIPGVPYLVSEAVGAIDGAPLYRWIDTEATLAIQATMHAQVHDIAQSNTAYAGLLGWAGIDYASLSGGNRIWNSVKWPGVLDTFRVPKPGAAFYTSQVDPGVRPVILPVFFWDFGTGSPTTGPGAGTMIATNCDTLEIYVGGVLFATGTPDTTDFGNLSYPPVFVDLTVSGTGSPDLRIDGYVNGAIVATLSMSSDTTQDRLVLSLDDATIQGDGSDATRFTFRALDAYGNQRPYPTGNVTLSVDGPATLIADNPFPFATYGGVGGGFLRSQPLAYGVVTLTATHPTLGQATAQLLVAPALAPPPGPGSPPQAKVAAVKPKVPSKATVRAALAKVLKPHGAAARIRQLLSHSGYTVTFDAPAPGRLVIDWYHVFTTHADGVRPGKHVVASATVVLRHKGRASVKIKLNATGRALLKHSTHVRVNVEAQFTTSGLATVRSSATINLNH
jgi:beta-galactosidase